MTFKEFYEKNKANKELAEKVKKCKTPEEFYELAKANGLTDSFEVFKSNAQKVVLESGDLTEKEVASISAGVSCQTGSYEDWLLFAYPPLLV